MYGLPRLRFANLRFDGVCAEEKAQKYAFSPILGAKRNKLLEPFPKLTP
jgi:hypothetical protein